MYFTMPATPRDISASGTSAANASSSASRHEQGKGPLILFLHGFPEFWYEWKTLLPEFARDHHAVAPDMRGYNLSGKPERVESYALPVLVEDVRALAQKLGAKKFVLVGHDGGGVVAWAFA